MKFGRFLYKKGAKKNSKKKNSWGIIENDRVRVINGSPFDKWEKTSSRLKVYDVQFLAPCVPSKIICVGLNYQDHAEELKKEIPDHPIIFLKPSSCVLDPEGYIKRPKECTKLDYEAELAVVMGKKARNIDIEDIDKYILGYTCFNDVTARDIQNIDGQWTRAKSFDTFAPFGPYIATEIDPNRLKIELILNDKTKQSSNTSKMNFNIQKIVSFVSEVMTLYPGDLIATGTPSGVGSMENGDVVEVAIEKIGALRNYVTDEKG